MKSFNIDVSIRIPLYLYDNIKDFLEKSKLDKVIDLSSYHIFDDNNQGYVDITTNVFDLLCISALLRKSLFNGNNSKDYQEILLFVNKILKKRGWM